jgi:transcriptional regulator with XRE-family HTH domain
MIGEEIRRQREVLGLTGAQLAAKAGMAPSAVSQIETGKRTPSSTSVLKLAYALGVEVGELYPKGQTPLPELVEERRSDWENAVNGARKLREHAQEQVSELLARWQESKDREEDPAERRPYLDDIGKILQEAYDAERALVRALSEPHIVDQWPELQEADRFYIELWRLVEGAGLSIRTGNAQQERPKAVEEREAA